MSELENLNMDSLEDEMDFMESTQGEPTEIVDEENVVDDKVVDDTTDKDEELKQELSDLKDTDSDAEEEADEEVEEEGNVAEDKNIEEEGTPSDDIDISDKLFSFASALAEEGVLTSFNDETKVESVEDLADLIKGQIKENELAGLNDKQKKYLEALEVGIPEEDFFRSESELEQLNNITKETLEENEELRKALLVDDFKSKGYSDEKATKLAQRSFDVGEDLEDAIEAKEARVSRIKKQEEDTINQRKSQIEEFKKSQAKQSEELKKSVFDESKEIINGIKFNKIVAQKTYDSMTKPVDFTEDGRPINKIMKDRLENPVEFEHRLHYVYNLTDGFKDFSKLNKVAKTKAVKDFESKLNDTRINTTLSGVSKQSGGDWSDTLDAVGKALSK